MLQQHSSRLNLKTIARRCRRVLIRRAPMGARWAAIVAYLTLALGIQFPLSLGKSSGHLYPCMNHPCGCASAEQCWRHCCCTSLEERLAWARENHVTPPEYALAEARGRGIDWEAYCKVGAEHESRVCRDGEEIEPTCCQHEHGAAKFAHPPQGIAWLQALACQGGAQNWMGLRVSLPPPAASRLFDSTVTAELFPIPPQQFLSISRAPPTPPPRAISA